MKTEKQGFKPAVFRKLDKLLIQKGYKFIGKSTENLKIKLNLMPNMVLTIA